MGWSGFSTARRTRRSSVRRDRRRILRARRRRRRRRIPDGAAVGDEEPAPAALPAQRRRRSASARRGKLLTDALGDAKHPQTRIQALAALGLLRSPARGEDDYGCDGEPDVDVRTAAALAAGQTKDRNLTTPLRNLLDDKEPQVAFTAAMTLWKMDDKSGEDILMAVVDGDRRAAPDADARDRAQDQQGPARPGGDGEAGRDAGRGDAAGTVRLRDYGVRIHSPERRRPGARVGDRGLAQERTEPIHKELVARWGTRTWRCARRRRRRWWITTTRRRRWRCMRCWRTQAAGAVDGGGGVPADDGRPGPMRRCTRPREARGDA